MLVLAGCQMREQARLEAYDPSPTFGVASRELEPGAVPIGYLRDDDHFYRGQIDGEYVDSFPMEVTEEMIRRGQERFEIFCTPCHGYAGYGDGVISQEGFPPPASFHDEEIRSLPAGYYVSVITNGKGAMLNYAARVNIEDRWAIASYIRTLQLSQQANVELLPEDVLDQIQSAPATSAQANP